MAREVAQLQVHPAYGLSALKRKGMRRFISQIIPLHTYIPFRAELGLAWVRLRSRSVRKRYRNSDNLLVNIGVGANGRQGWVNIDATPFPQVNCIYDCRKSLPFPDTSVKGIFCEHFFEHIDYTEEVPYFLSECYRVLKPEGVIRLIVPDGEKYLRAYCGGGWEGLTKVRPLDSSRTDFYFGCKYETAMELINVVFRQGYEHKYTYDYATLAGALRRYGFATVLKQEYGNSLMPELCLDLVCRATESLYVEARK